MIKKTIYYLVAIVIGIYLSYLTLGSSVSTSFIIDGKTISFQELSLYFDRLLEVESETVIDYDGLISTFTGSRSDIFPEIMIAGDTSTPSAIDNGIFFITISTMLVIFALIHWIYQMSTSHNE